MSRNLCCILTLLTLLGSVYAGVLARAGPGISVHNSNFSADALLGRG